MEHNTNTPKTTLDDYRIASLPPSFYYIPSFLSTAESTALLQKIPPNRWTHLSNRRLQAHPSTLTKPNKLIEAPLPPWLTTPILQRFENLGVFDGTLHSGPNHVLVNEYRPGQGIMPHEDGGVYETVVATVGLGGSVVLDVYEKTDLSQPRWRILQEPGSLLVTRGEAYGDLIHGISDVSEDTDLGADTVANWEMLGERGAFEGGVNVRETRVSLTYRDVKVVSKIGVNILGRR